MSLTAPKGIGRGLGLCLAGVALAATIAPIARYAIHDCQLDPLVFTSIWLLSAGLWAGLMGGLRPDGPPLLLHKHWPVLLLVGSLHLCAATCGFVAFQTISASAFAFLYSTSLPIAFVLSMTVLGERAAKGQIIGLMLAVVGLGVFILPRAGVALSTLGVSLALANALLTACVDLMVKHVSRRMPVWPIVCARAVLPGVCLMLVNLFVRAAPFPDGRLLALLLVGSILGPYLGFYLLFRSLVFLPLTVASVLRSLQPVMSALYAALILGETLGWVQAVGGALIVSGVALAPARAKRTTS